MGDILKKWLQRRLGVIIDLSPEFFGHHARDGTLLAKLLHSYDIINDSQLNTIIRTQDPTLCRVNLKHLRLWLRFIEVDCNDECIEEISNGRGTTALRLYYKLYLSLENKDRLHFITLKKEREKYIPTSTKFDVTTVSEEPRAQEPADHPLAGPLIQKADAIEWHRNKFQAIVDACKRERNRFKVAQERRSSFEVEEETGTRTKKMNSCESVERRDIDEFERKHGTARSIDYTYEELCEERRLGEMTRPPLVDPEAARIYVKLMKSRDRRARTITTRDFKSRMQKTLQADVWERLVNSQEREFDEVIAKKVLSQSRYEKQMTTKLLEICEQKTRITRNRRIVDELVEEARAVDVGMKQDRLREVAVMEAEEVEAENRRMCELRRRIEDGKVRMLREKHRRICAKIVYDLVDVAVKAADYRAGNASCIPARVWKEWKTLFVEKQPIFELVENVERIVGSRLEDDVEEIFRAEIERQEVLDDAYFESYHGANGPWDEFAPEVEPEVEESLRLGSVVLGYVVHRILECLYPHPPELETAPVPKVTSAVIVLGILDVTIYPALQELLKHSGIKLIRMEDAINHCLSRYKEEIKDVDSVDLNIIAATNEVRRREQLNANTPLSRKDTKKDKKPGKLERTESSLMSGFKRDKQTQTSRVVPYDDMDPDLTDTGYVGKWTYEFLTLGQPISDELNTKILIEYLKSLTDVSGWVLINYPNTYRQMACLEFALTGREVPAEEERIDGKDFNIEDVDPISPRISFAEKGADGLSVCRESRLVPNPIVRSKAGAGASFMTAYIRVVPKLKNVELDETELFEIMPDDAMPMDAFYVDQGLALALYYTTFDLFTLKRLARLVIGDTSIPRKSSVELFGNDALKLLEDKMEEPSRNKAPIVKRLIQRQVNNESVWSSEGEEEEDDTVSLADVLDAKSAEPPASSLPIKPGEDGWDWINFPQDVKLLQALACLWENLESVYVQNLKEIFFIERIQYSAIVPYKNYVTKHMIEYIQRPDSKQDLLHKFHKAFNEISMDMRDDLDVKCELHCRVADFQTELWEICDQRRECAENERRRIIRENWVAEEVVVLANLYTSMIQAEIDRCVDTLQLIKDYYTSMLQRPILEARFAKVLLQRLELVAEPSLSREEQKSANVEEAKETKVTKGKNNVSISSDQTIDCSSIKNEIAELLIVYDEEASSEKNVTEQNSCYKAVRANVERVRSILESMVSSMMEYIKTVGTNASGRPASKAETKGKGQSTRTSLATSATETLLKTNLLNRTTDLCQEWRSAVNFESNRIRSKLHMLDAAALSNIGFLLETTKSTFHGIQRDLNERYRREMKSVNDMASVFCFAIEQAMQIQEEMLLDGDRFVVRSSVLMYPKKPSPTPSPVREEILSSQFRMAQLGRLMDIFRHVAPHGSLPERFFVYILQDMIACGQEEGGMAPLPASWSELRPDEVAALVTRLFGNVEYIEWREFIVHAMDLPMPSFQQILDARCQFRSMDPELREVVTRQDFHEVDLWFSLGCSNDSTLKCGRMLHEEFQRDEDEMYEEELMVDGTDGIDDFGLENREAEDPRRMMRLMLAKELLCQMFLTSCHAVNYTVFLLAFCKAEDPRAGFGKAMTLVLGERVCTDWEDGERYVMHLLAQKRLVAETEAARDYLREEAASIVQSILDEILENALQQTEGITITEIRFSIDTNDEDVDYAAMHSIKIESLDGRGWINPKDLLPKDQDLSSNENLDTESDISIVKKTLGEIVSSTSDESKDGIGANGERVIYWVSREVCQTVLTAALPWHARQPDLFHSTETLREGLARVFVNLKDKELNEEDDVVLAHRLVNHDFIVNLLASTSKFTTKYVGNLLDQVLNERDRNTDER